eukprot:m.64505 g.64505  ORF g.64505 m.64505 type:complete len:462 (+) comp9723_c0_seq2:168-1553(+)
MAWFWANLAVVAMLGYVTAHIEQVSVNANKVMPPILSEVELLALEVEMLENTIQKKERALKRHYAEMNVHRPGVPLPTVHRPVGNDDVPRPIAATVNTDLAKYVQDEMRLQPGATIIFTAATKGFIRGVVNWLALLHRLELTCVFIFAMDRETFEWFDARGLTPYAFDVNDSEYKSKQSAKGMGNSNNKFRRMQVWYQRSRIIRDLLILGYTVVQSDGDALWLQNPMFELHALPSRVDIAFSRGNARAGKAGRGTGVCMGFVMYRPKPGAIAFVQDLLDRMMEVYDVDQGIANSFVGGPRGQNRDTDKYNASLFFGSYKNTTWVQLPQTRYARHGGRGLVSVEDSVDLHVFHPADEGWALPFKFLPRILPPNISTRPKNESEEVKVVCQAGRWFERMGYSERDQRILDCCGLWMLKESWQADPRRSSESFSKWINRNSHIELAKKFKKAQGKPAYKELVAH